MNWKLFQDPKKRFSIVLFVQPDDLEAKRKDIESLGNQRNVKLIVQPCPFEGIEFLYRVAHDLFGHHVSAEKDIFWQAIELKGDVPPEVFSKISKHHYDYLCGLLEQDAKKVSKEGKIIESFSEYFVSPQA